MNTKVIFGVSILAVILIVLGSQGNVAGNQLTPFSKVSNGKPDLTIVGVRGEYYLDGGTLKCDIKNIGTAPSADYLLRVNGYILGFIHYYHMENHGFPYINPGETKSLVCTMGGPFIGVIRLRCNVNTSIPEENYKNNYYAHSYFIVSLGPLWVFKDLPY
jgi:hypothetical protein